jgi:YegS/Rv2252/BmrU family lipid kinase
MSNKTLVIVNPMSAAGRAKKEWPNLSRTLQGRYGEFDTRFTTRAGEAADIARQGINEGFETIIGVGGDGTLNEVSNGFFHPATPNEPLKAINPNAAIGLYPFGTGGDFRKTIGIPKSPNDAARTLRDAARRPIDVGKLDYTTSTGETKSRVFINIASFGLSGVVDEYVERGPKWLGGKASFFLASTQAVFAYTPQPVHLELDGQVIVEGDIYFTAVSNGQYFGGGMWVAPEAKLNDGLFDIIVVRGMPKAKWILNGSSIYSGKHLRLPEVSTYRGKKLIARSLANDPVRLDVDGEQPGALNATFEIFPGLIQALWPA